MQRILALLCGLALAILLVLSGCHHETIETLPARPTVSTAGPRSAAACEQQALDLVNQTGRDIHSATTLQQLHPITDKLLGIVVRARKITTSAQSSSQSPPPGAHFWNRTAIFLLDACIHQSQFISGTRPHADQEVDASIAKARDTSRYCDIPMP